MSDIDNTKQIKEAVDWYVRNQHLYKSLSQKIETILRELIELENIPFHVVYSRVKDIDSFSNKITRKNYLNPENDIKDLAGIRIITYVESQIEPICKIIESAFDIDHENSHDKSEELGIDRVGYKSVHYVAKLKKDRIKLPEYKRFEFRPFEIQVRTILQHAWAEIEHDRNYKFGGKLPINIQRRFKLLAGQLELADREFNSISNEIDKISKDVEIATIRGELNIPINSTSIKQYLSTKFDVLFKNGAINAFRTPLRELDTLQEIEKYGLKTLKDLDKLIPINFIENQIKTGAVKDNPLSGILIDIMIINNYKKYFETAWSIEHWAVYNTESANFYILYNVPIGEINQRYGLNIAE